MFKILSVSALQVTAMVFALSFFSQLSLAAPSFQASQGTPALTSATGTTITIAIDLDESGTAYAVAVPEWQDQPSAAQVKAGNNASDSAAVSANSIALTSGIFAGTLTLTGLTDGTAYDVYVVAEDSVSDLQASSTLVSTSGLYIHMNGVSDADCYDIINIGGSNIGASTRNFGCPGGYDEDFALDGAFAATGGETCDSSDSYSDSVATSDGFYCFRNTTHNASNEHYYGYVEIACGKITKAVAGSTFDEGVTLPGVLTSTSCITPDLAMSSISADSGGAVAPDTTTTFTVTFSENATGVDTSDFEVYDCYDGAGCASFGSARAPVSVSSSSCSPSCTVTVNTTSSGDGSYVSGTTTVSLWNLNDGTIKDSDNTPLQTAAYAVVGHAVVDDSAAVPEITSATYNFATGVFVVTGANFEANAGAANDVDVSDLTVTGEGGGTYTLTSATDVEIDNSTQFTVTLTGADLLAVNALLNKDGASSDDSTTYNLAAADDFITNVTSGDTSDSTATITVSSVAVPAITSATYDASTGSLVVTGTSFSAVTGSNNDVDVSTLTLTGDGSNTYTLTSTDVDVSSSTAFTVSLNATDITNINGLLNKDGTSSDDGTTYNLAAADNWLAGAAASSDIADTSGNGITVSSVALPSISAASYDASTGTLVVTGTNFVNENGSTNDVDASALTLTGEGGNSYTLTTSDAEITSATAFTLSLSAVDIQNVNGLLNTNGTSADDSTTYNLAAADNWMPGAAATENTADLTGNSVTVSNVANPTLTSATYNASTGVLTVTGTNFVHLPGATNDVDVSTLTLTGEGGGTYTLTTSSIEITSATAFTVTLNSTDVLNVNGLLNKDGTLADDNTTYNLAAADNWMAGAASSTNIADLTSNAITVSSVSTPTITSATYDADTGILVVTATGLVSQSGSANDVDISTFTFTGEAGGTYTLTSATDVDITSATSFSVTLSGADKTSVDALLNSNGTSSDDSTTYNLAAADNWLTGAASSLNIADATAGITVSNVLDVDGTVTAGSGVTEPVSLDTVLDSAGEALAIFDFVISDGGSSDGQVLTVSEIRVNTSGTLDASQLSYVLNGPDASNVSGSYNANVITFTSLGISVADGGGETYTVSAYYNTNTGLTEGQTLVLSVDGDSDLTVGSTTSQMASSSALTNGSGTTVDVVATVLAFTTQPAGSVSGTVLTTQPVVTARDAAGNTDTDFTETITLSEASAGTLTGASVAAVAGVATFTSVNYTATADQQSFTLTANDQDGVGSDLGTVDSNAVTSDVAATELAFTTQPAGSVSGAALTTQPVVTARDGDGNTDTGFTGLVTLSESSAGSLSNNTATAVAGIATFSGVTYTATSDQESFTLSASATGVSSDNANALTSDVVATELAFSTQPAGSVSGVNLTTQPVVVARDAAGVTDTGFTETITLTEASAGTLTGGTVAAVAGVATFTSVNYTATVDQESFTLTANDQDGVGSDLGTVDSNAVTSDVVATQLVFDTQPAGLSVFSGQALSLTTVPVISARNADNLVDTGFSAEISLTEVNGAGTAELSSTGDTDGSAASTTLTPSAGIATFTGLQVTYTNAASTTETFNLQASATGVSSANSSQFTSTPSDTDGSLTAAGGVIEPVALSYSADTVGEAVNLFDFTLSDGGSGDSLAMSVSEVRMAVTGTTSDTDRAKITWRLNGAGVSNVSGSYNASTDVLTFTGLSISVADGTSEVYTVSGYFNDNTGLTHGSTVILSLDGDTDLTVGSSGTQMAATSAISNGSGTVINDDLGATITSLTLPSDGTYVAGEDLDFTVNYDENVIVNTSGGTPRLTLVVGASTRYASYRSGSGSSALVFRHVVTAGDVDSDGISLATSVDNNSGTIQDSQSNDVSTNIDSIDSLAAVLVDAQAPTIAETVAVAPLANDSTPNVSFTSDEAGNLSVDGSCGSASEGAISSGSQTIALTQSDNSSGLGDGTYSDCSLTVTDAAGNTSNTVTLTSFTVDITPPTVATNTGQTLDEGGTATVANTLLAASDNNSTAADITYTLVTAPTNGTLSNGGDLSDGATFTQEDIDNDQVSYTHDGGESSSDSLVFTVSDGVGNVNNNSASNFTYTLTIDSVNDAPVASDDAQATNEDEAVMVDVLANDTDADNAINAASVSVVSAPSNGETSINTGTGVITYTPSTDFNGSDSFTYNVEDASGEASNVATVSITVLPQNDAPLAVADMADTDINTLVTIDVAANDTDIDADDGPDSATLVIVSTPANGTAVINAGEINYTPASDFTGTDTFTYTIDDSVGTTSNVATVTINVTDPNSLPVAVNDSATTEEDSAVGVSVLDNDTDADGTIVVSTLSIMTAPANGETSVNTTTGVITYTPNSNFNGTDSFTYIVQDDAGGTSNAGTVSITINSVNDAPVLADDVVALLEDNSLNINVLGNDADVDGNVDATSVAIVSEPAQGSASVNATTGVITYTPADNYSGNDSFTYSALDNEGAASNVATVTLTVEAINDAPLANNDAAEVLTEQAVNINLLANDIDVDGELDASTVIITASPTLGGLVNNNDGTFTYTPTTAESGSDSFTYTVEDDQGAASNTATVDIVITRPAAITISTTSVPPATVEEGEAYSFTPEVTVFEGLTPAFSIQNVPAWLIFDSSDGSLSGTPSADDIGTTENIVITVSDGYTEATTAAFSITVASSVDSDGDNVSDFQEGLDQTDPNDATDYFDITPPTMFVPEDIILDATALFTPVSLAEVLGLSVGAEQDDIQTQLDFIAADNVEGAGCCNPVVTTMNEELLLLAPGVNNITWRATDFRGNVSEQTQAIHIRPLVSFGKDKTTVEGSTVNIQVLLNGIAPTYPLVVPYVIDTSASSTDNTEVEGQISSSDHDLNHGFVTFNEGETEVIITVNTTADAVTETDEVLVVRLDDRTANSEDLGDGFEANIYDINSGVKNTYQLTIVERNIAPEIALQIEQSGASTIQISQSGGNVVVTSHIDDENPNDTFSLDWSLTDNRLTDIDTTESSFTFDPSALNTGLYRVTLVVTDSQGATDTAKVSLVVMAALPDLQSNMDTDGDGVDDVTEGTADNDNDGIPNFLDNITLPNVIPEIIEESESFLIECEPGVRCRLGEFALLGQTGGARIDDMDIEVLEDITPDEAFIPIGGTFDFEVHELPTLGQQVSVVIPQITAIPEDAVYRKFQDNQWQNFVSDANNQIHSSAGRLGFCPPPGDTRWQAGLVPGFFCVQLTIEDGGPNDADGEVNGAISDPGVVSQRRITQVNTSGGGAMTVSMLILLLGLLLLFAHTHRRRYSSLSIFMVVLTISLFTPQHVVAETVGSRWGEIAEKSALAFSVYQVESSQSESDFSGELASAGIDITLNAYDVSASAFKLAYLYRLHPQGELVIAYSDLGDVTTGFAAAITDESLIRSALEEAHPLTGNGLTLGYRYHHQFMPKLTGFVEAGAFIWEADLDTDIGGIKPDHDGGTDLTFSFGGDYLLGQKISLSLSYLHHVLDDQDVSGFGLGVMYRFY